jgi:hypothetical protein
MFSTRTLVDQPGESRRGAFAELVKGSGCPCAVGRDMPTVYTKVIGRMQQAVQEKNRGAWREKT